MVPRYKCAWTAKREFHLTVPPSKTLAERLDDALLERGMSGAELADTVGVSANSVSSWRRGRYRPGRDKLVKIADALQVGLDDLLRDPPAPKPPAPSKTASEALVIRLADLGLVDRLSQLETVAPSLMDILRDAEDEAKRLGS